MRVSAPNDIKIYHLNAGKSVPEWLSERKKRLLLKKDVDVRRRIKLLQDFNMPGVSTSIKVSKDGQYILATGIYKPRVKCFDVNNLSLKFERCFDSEAVTFEILTDDYSKIIFLQDDRYVEFHAAYGKHYRLRVPHYGRDLKHHYPSCDTFIVGNSNEIYRINLQLGQFLRSFMTEASSINKCEINPEHHLLLVGTEDGKIEAWDPRIKGRVGTLDCAFDCILRQDKSTSLEAVPAVTALKCQGAFNLGVGTSTGKVLLYDIRSSKPFSVKDHMNELPIKYIDFHSTMNLVYSMDSSIVKIWEKDNGKLYTSIQAEHDFNDLCIIPNTGMVLMANETENMQMYYIPSLGPAPYWCNFLDNLTEELEELNRDVIYDDFKFVTEKELDELDLLHLKGTNLLRAYMHGYFMNTRLYRKAKNLIKPFDIEDYKKSRIREIIKEQTSSRIQVQKLPSINQELALKLMENANNKNKKKQASSSLLQDERFKALFNNPDFEIDKDSEEYALLNPVISQMDKNKIKKLKLAQEAEREREALSEDESQDKNKNHSSDESFIHDSSDSSDDEKPWVKQVRKNYRLIRKNEREREQESENKDDDSVKNGPKLDEIKNNVKFEAGESVKKHRNNLTLGERLAIEETHDIKISGSRGNREMTFTVKKKKRPAKMKHYVERDYNASRSAKSLFKKKY